MAWSRLLETKPGCFSRMVKAREAGVSLDLFAPPGFGFTARLLFRETSDDVFVAGMGREPDETFKVMPSDTKTIDLGFEFGGVPCGLGLTTSLVGVDPGRNSSVDVTSGALVFTGRGFTESTVTVFRPFAAFPALAVFEDGESFTVNRRKPSAIGAYPMFSGKRQYLVRRDQIILVDDEPRESSVVAAHKRITRAVPPRIVEGSRFEIGDPKLGIRLAKNDTVARGFDIAVAPTKRIEPFRQDAPMNIEIFTNPISGNGRLEPT